MKGIPINHTNMNTLHAKMELVINEEKNEVDIDVTVTDKTENKVIFYGDWQFKRRQIHTVNVFEIIAEDITKALAKHGSKYGS